MWENYWEKETFFASNFLRSFRFWFTFCYNESDFQRRFFNVSYFEQAFNNSSDLESKFLKRARFRINLFNTREKLNRKFYNASDFEGKTFVENQFFWKICSQRINFTVSFYTVKATKLALSCFLANLDTDTFVWKEYIFSIIFFEQPQIFKPVYQNMWDYGTRLKNMSHFEQRFRNLPIL